MKFGPVVLAALFGTAAAPASAMVVDKGSVELRQYVQARLSDEAGKPEAAATVYARLLAAAPDDKVLAIRAFRQALTAGDFVLATQAAVQLDRLGALSADGTMLFLANAVLAKDWARARALCDRIKREEIFAFLLPVIRGWIAVDAKGDGLRELDAGAAQSQLSSSYARDHRILIALATGHKDEALKALQGLIAQNDVRSLRLRLAAAAELAKSGDVATARTLLDGPAPELVAARERLDAGKSLPGAIDNAPMGLSELFTQLGMDVKGSGKSPMSLQLARLATYVAPSSTAARVAAAELLADSDYRDAALALLAEVGSDDPLYESARQVRIGILMAKGDAQTALAEAQRVATKPGASARQMVELGDILADLDRPAEAATAYQRAVAVDRAEASPNWAHLFLLAGALDKAGQWPAAKTALAEANRIDPQQAIVLNYLGYGMLEHGENLAEAQAYIERASTLDPSDAAISDSLGWLYYKRGNYAGAIAALERAVAGDPGEGVMHEHLGDAYWSSGRRIEARYAWRAAQIQATDADKARIDRKLTDGLTTGTVSKRP